MTHEQLDVLLPLDFDVSKITKIAKKKLKDAMEKLKPLSLNLEDVEKQLEKMTKLFDVPAVSEIEFNLVAGRKITGTGTAEKTAIEMLLGIDFGLSIAGEFSRTKGIKVKMTRKCRDAGEKKQ